MLTLILAEAELECTPSEIWSHPIIASYTRKRKKQLGSLLLDSNLHHGAMRMLPEGERRGRPDIVHYFLLTCLESIANKQQHLRLLVHTRHNQGIFIDPSTRIMRNYTRFIGLFEQLFLQKKIATDDTILLRLEENRSLKSLIDQVDADVVVACHETAPMVNLPAYFTKIKQSGKDHIAFIIGGFPHGDFHTDLNTIADDHIAVYHESLVTWTVASELIINYENTFLSLKSK
jgi:rRNA small subunit pseudouridine methyltransferase Nep1